MQEPMFINFKPLNVMQKLYEIKARQDGSKMKVIVREITPEEAARAAGGFMKPQAQAV